MTNFYHSKDRGGAHNFYQLVAELITPDKDDPEFKWKSEFLKKYWFFEEAILVGFSRTPKNSAFPKQLNNVIFTKAAATTADIPFNA